MTQHIIDIHSISKAFESLAGLTGLSYFLYDDRGNILIAPTKEDEILAYMKRQEGGKELYNEFLKRTFRIVYRRREPLIVKGPAQQYHIFIPVQYKALKMIILTEAFYASKEDFKNYVEENWSKHLMGERNLDEWMKRISVIPLSEIDPMVRNIHQLLENLVISGCENKDLNKRWLWFKTMINLVANIRSDTSLTEIYENIVDAVIFLFNVDSAGIYERSNGDYTAVTCGGRNRNIIEKIKLPGESTYISKASATRTPVSIMDSVELWHLRIPEEIISLYLFPIESSVGSFSFLGIFNSLIDPDAHYSIGELCRLTSYFCISRFEDNEMKRETEALNYVYLKTSELYANIKDSEKVFDMIVDEASNLVGAEKCSLMLPDIEKSFLKIAAVKGMNSALVEDVKVRKGEGIAGNAYEKGTPVLIEKEEGFVNYAITPRSFYKTSSCISIPLKIAEDVVGILNLSDKSSGESFSQSDIAKLNYFAFQASVLIKLSYYYERSETMKELSITDSLTGLYNRRYFDMQLEEEFKRSERYGLSYSLAIVDIDDFKLFNDSEGHIAGDGILKEISLIMTSTLRTNDILVRLGGEEFAIIMPQTSDSEAYNVAERIRSNIKKQVIPAWKRYPKKHLTVSVGLSTYPSCGDQLTDIVKYADRALYKAKIQGKDRTMSWQNTGHQSKDDDKDHGLGNDPRLSYL